MGDISLVLGLKRHTEVELYICMFDLRESDKWNLKVLERILEDTGIIMCEVLEFCGVCLAN